ncbi:transposase, partial [candidate division WOR-3 bacterium]|nr:transposase [candidate division WOR-3 bacterium]
MVPLVGKTWARRGMTPVLTHRGSWPKLSAISAVTSNPHVYLKLFPRQTIRADQVVIFLKHLLRHIPGRVSILWDRIATHRAEKVLNFIRNHRARLTVSYFPPYTPELNPDEGLWDHLKWHQL